MANSNLNKLRKWSLVLAGWHLGSKSMIDGAGHVMPGVRHMRDLMDRWLIMRVEISALTTLMIEKGVFTAEEFMTAANREAASLDSDLEDAFPGLRTTSEGVIIYNPDLARDTMIIKGFPP